MEALSTSLRGTGRWLVELANPALAAGDAYAARACAGMPLVELDHAMVAVAGYAALVAYGVATRPAAKPKAAGAEAEKAADAAPRAASRGASGGKKSGGGFSAAAALAKLQKEPLMILMLLYNVAQVALCGYMMVEALRVAYANYFPRVICNAHSNTAASKLKDVLWLFYVSKVLDFADTFFIVVRGKWEQFSFLHIYHHFSIFLTYWLVANAAPDGDVYYTVVANSFVHFVSEYDERQAPRLLYFYYGCACIGVKPFANVVTELQLTQFVTMMGQATFILGYGCAYPNRVTAYYLGYILSLFMLFRAFYDNKYVAPAGKSAAAGGKAIEEDPKPAKGGARAAAAAKAASPAPAPARRGSVKS